MLWGSLHCSSLREHLVSRAKKPDVLASYCSTGTMVIFTLGSAALMSIVYLQYWPALAGKYYRGRELVKGVLLSGVAIILVRNISYTKSSGVKYASHVVQIWPKEGYIGAYDIIVLDNFSWSILVILISKCSIAVFSKPVGCVVLAFWKVLKIIVQVLQCFPNLFQFLVGHSQ